MFTGLIEAVGEVIELKPTDHGFWLRLSTPLADRLVPGDSLAVNGVCLTVTRADTGEVHADIGSETARVTTLGTVARGTILNLERPVAADGRMGGHFVQGHVDGTGTIEDIKVEGDTHWLAVGFPLALAPFFIRRGSVAVDGVSLTVAGLGADRFDVQIVPFTWTHTNLATRRVHDRVNLECDMIGKYVARSLELAGDDRPRMAH